MKLTADLLREIVRYEPGTGRLFWLERRPELFSCKGKGGAQSNADRWNGKFAGKECFLAFDGGGYHIASIFDLTRKAHRVAWTIQTGAWPKAQIDHRNNNPGDNRWDNLREAVPAQNCHNANAQAGAASAFKGVTWHKRDQIWFARIYTDGRRTQIGSFGNEIEAAKAYDEAARRLFGQFAKLNFPNAL